MIVNIITLFPDMFSRVFSESILSRAIQGGHLDARVVHLREYGLGSHRVVDDTPYGGGGGMILKPEPIAAALEDLPERGHVILTTPRGKLFRQADALRLSSHDVITLICGHYEGVDERVSELFVHEELSIGDYVLTGGELAAAVITDSVVRLLPGAISDETSALTDSFQDNLLSPPVYTRPAEYKGMKVPEILLSGNDKLIDDWKHRQAVERTKKLRPDLYRKYSGEADE